YYGESYLEELAGRGDLKVINLRLASLMGPGMEARITTRLLKSAVQEGVIRVQSGGEAFSYLHLSDAARMLGQLLSRLGQARYDRYNVGTCEYYSLKQVAQVIGQLLMNQGLAEMKLTINPLQEPAYNNRMVLDRLDQDFGLQAEIDLATALRADFERLFR
ncbi:MAG TPA: NAD-dependent epimerase/dehydratase family protein, partial [Clostridia bacterium]|nr:NAD-dependent epimerase/dehydratase family protein [Clostridia bacterium]